MSSERYTPLLLLFLDVVVAVLVFNVVAHYRGISAHLLLTPLAGPVIALVV